MNQSQFDEQLRLIHAENRAEALRKSREIGKMEETVFVNIKGETVKWDFIDVSDLQPIQNLEHGVEIFSSTYVDEESTEYINFIRQKANLIQIDKMVLG